MADLRVNLAGISSPNPFWLASGPPTNTKGQVLRAFEAGWGGAVWKTLSGPGIVNVSSRYGALQHHGRRMVGFNNIELISDRPLADNIVEMAEVKRAFPDRALIASIMLETKAEWQDAVRRCEDAGVDGFELNFGCPHGMCERGLGSVIGQNPDLAEEITGWVAEVATRPVLVKLTPNITDITQSGLAAQRGGAHAVSLINTINSLIGVDLDSWEPLPAVAGQGTHGGYCGPAVKPIALHMVSQLATHPDFHLPLSGIGGIETWRDAVEFMLLGATTVQLCTAVMHYGFRIIDDLTSGLSGYLDRKGLRSAQQLIGAAAPRVTRWEALDFNYRVIANIDANRCIGCQLCYVACEDGAHQAIALEPGTRVPRILEEACVGCNLCHHVCPVDGCITMTPVETGLPKLTWAEHPENPRCRLIDSRAKLL